MGNRDCNGELLLEIVVTGNCNSEESWKLGGPGDGLGTSLKGFCGPGPADGTCCGLCGDQEMLRILREAKARQQSSTEQEYRDILAASQGFTPPNPTPIDIRRPLSFLDHGEGTPEAGAVVQAFPSPPALPPGAGDGTPGGLLDQAPAGDRTLRAGSGRIPTFAGNLRYGGSGVDGASRDRQGPGDRAAGNVHASLEETGNALGTGSLRGTHAVNDIEDLGGSYALQEQRNDREPHHGTYWQQDSEAMLQVRLVACSNPAHSLYKHLTFFPRWLFLFLCSPPA